MKKNAAHNFVAVIDYGSGNLRSVARALEHTIATLGLSLAVRITSDPQDIAQAVRIVLPGQGAFGDCMAGLSAILGMREILEERVVHKGVPFLGICVGMQLMATRGLEHGDHAGLGWIEGQVVPLNPHTQEMKIPHMGWNEVYPTNAHAVGRSLRAEGEHFYFVHSFVMECAHPAHILGRTNYGIPFASMVGRDNMLGVQFHPEKSHRAGLTLLSHFMYRRP